MGAARKALSGSEFNAKHPRGAGGKFVKKGGAAALLQAAPTQATAPSASALANVHLDALRGMASRQAAGAHLGSLLVGSRTAVAEDLGIKGSGRFKKTQEAILDKLFPEAPGANAGSANEPATKARDLLSRRIKQIDEAMDEVDGPAARQLNDTRKALVEQRAALGPAPVVPPAPAAKKPARARDIMKAKSSTTSNVGDVAQQLKGLPISQEGLDQAQAMVAGLSVKELRELAKEIGPTVNAKGNKADLARAIAEGTVGFRLRAAATNPGGSFGQKPDAGRINGPAATARRMATMRAREGSAMDVGNSAELQSAVEAQWADWAARTGGKRDAGRPARELGGIKEPASQSDTYVLSHMVTNKANLGMRQEQAYFLAVPRDRRSGVLGSMVVSNPDQIPAEIKRYFETTVSGDIYENDRETGQRRWIGRVKPEEVLPPLEEGVQEKHRRRDPDAGMTEWHNHERPAWWDNSKTWVDDGAAPDEPALVTPSTPAPKRARQLLAARPAAARNEWTALPVAELTSKLSNVTADDEAKVRGALEGRSKAELTAIARQIDTVGSAGSSTANQLIEAIVLGTVGFRSRARAMRS